MFSFMAYNKIQFLKRNVSSIRLQVDIALVLMYPEVGLDLGIVHSLRG